MFMIRTQVYIPDDLYKEAKFYAQIGNKNISQLMREGLKLAIKTENKKKKTVEKNSKKLFKLSDMAGIINTGHKKTNIAEHHNDIYNL